MKKRRTRRKTAHWVVEYNHTLNCIDEAVQRGGADVSSCTCDNDWTLVDEAFFFRAVINNSKRTLKSYTWASRPRTIATVLRAVVEQKEIVEMWHKRGVHYRIRNVKTQENYPIEAFQE